MIQCRRCSQLFMYTTTTVDSSHCREMSEIAQFKLIDVILLNTNTLCNKELVCLMN